MAPFCLRFRGSEGADGEEAWVHRQLPPKRPLGLVWFALFRWYHHVLHHVLVTPNTAGDPACWAGRQV